MPTHAPDKPAETTGRFHNPDRNYFFEAPAHWVTNYHPEHRNIVQAMRPDGVASVAASAFKARPDIDLEAFAQARFGAREDYLQPVAGARRLANGVYREYAGTDPTDRQYLYWVIGAVESAEMFVSFSIVTPREDFERNRRFYERIMESVRAA